MGYNYLSMNYIHHEFSFTVIECGAWIRNYTPEFDVDVFTYSMLAWLISVSKTDS